MPFPTGPGVWKEGFGGSRPCLFGSIPSVTTGRQRRGNHNWGMQRAPLKWPSLGGYLIFRPSPCSPKRGFISSSSIDFSSLPSFDLLDFPSSMSSMGKMGTNSPPSPKSPQCRTWPCSSLSSRQRRSAGPEVFHVLAAVAAVICS